MAQVLNFNGPLISLAGHPVLGVRGLEYRVVLVPHIGLTVGYSLFSRRLIGRLLGHRLDIIFVRTCSKLPRIG
jgi:hypothetical protein